MTSPIDPIRRAQRLRRAVRAEVDPAAETEGGGLSRLPVPVEPPRTASPRVEPPPAETAFGAQLLGQDGQKRGLRAGPGAIEGAKASYNRVEWSGSKDRRSRKGRIAKTEI